MGRVVFGNSSERGKGLRLDSLLQDIAADLAAEAFLPLAPLAHDPALAKDPPLASDQPVTNPSDQLDMLSSSSEAGVSLSRHQDILTKFQAAIAVSTSSNSLTR